MNAERCELFSACRRVEPDAVQSFDAMSFDFEFPRGANHCFFELMDVPADIPAMLGEIEDRIADDLPGAVIGDIAAAIGGMKLDIHLPKHAIRGAQVFELAVAAKRDDVRMLAEEQNIGNRTGLAGLDRATLQFARGRVGD